ncbi:hypothetical protein JTB14_009676 [Gonioctena quinquepunctata]|nr:hypothetical protein JTB14_009676 [Gonioctena quinquepunctata]
MFTTTEKGLAKNFRNWKKHHRVIRKDHFPRLLKRALADVEANKETNIKSGFSATGLVPLIDKNTQYSARKSWLKRSLKHEYPLPLKKCLKTTDSVVLDHFL